MLKIENRSTIRALRAYLEKIHLGEIMQSIRPSIPVEDPWPSYLHFKQSLARLPDGLRPGFELFVLGDEVPLAAAEASMGRELLRGLIDTGVLASAREGAVSTLGRAIVPFSGFFIFADLPAYYPNARGRQQQIFVDRSTMFLARVLPATRRRRAAEICAGAGLLSLFMSTAAEEVVSCDLNPVAINAGQFNAVLNHLEDRVRFIESDLMSAYPKEPLDLIVSNPPYLALPKGSTFEHYWAGDGGVDGMDLVYKILDQSVSRMGPSSTAYIMIAGYGDEVGPSSRHRILELARANDWSTKLVLFYGPAIEEYLQLHEINMDNPELFASEVRKYTAANNLTRYFLSLLTIRPASAQDPAGLEVLNSLGNTAQRAREMRRIRAAMASSAAAQGE
ncbi:MAG: methyltransferase [Kofleriaceae bacterium]